MIHDVHAPGSITEAEEHVTCAQEYRLQRLLADAMHHRPVGGGIDLEEGVLGKYREVKFIAELHLQRRGDLLQQLDFLLRKVSVLLLYHVLEVAPNAYRKGERDAVVAKVAVEFEEVLGLDTAEVPKMRHEVGDAADQGGEGKKSKEQYGHGKDALREVLWLHGHGRGRELCEGPMQGREVQHRHGLTCGVHSDPTPCAASDEVPEAGDHVVDEQDAKHVVA
mmetsp:Transcript_22142/g.50604  ORF Transcript_22142/g.50604 Transcript_22142/m.50604 type:complete len:222 (+) Transcript_22142:581-1246(+)